MLAAALTIVVPLILIAQSGRHAVSQPTPVVRISSAIALEMCNRIEFVVVTKSNGDAALLLDPAREAIELLDKTISDPKRKQVVHMQCPHSDATI